MEGDFRGGLNLLLMSPSGHRTNPLTRESAARKMEGVAGGAMGWFIGRHVWKTHQDHAIHPHSRIEAQLIPQFSRATSSYGITVGLSKPRQ